MSKPLRALILEDSLSDFKLVLHELRKAGFEVDGQRAQTEPDYLAGLTPELDVILSDYHMPGFGAPRALELLLERGLDVPFIVVSGAIGEDAAVEIMRHGATDYLLKDRLTRLGPAISNAIEKRRSAAALRESEQRFRELATNIDDVFWISDVNLERFHYVSPAFERLWARSAENLDQDGRSVLEWVVEEDRAIVASIVAQLGEPRRTETEVRVRRPDRSIRWLWNRTFPILDSSGHVQRIAGLTTDITNRKEIEQALAKARDAALESSRLKSAFLANMDHEIRTPLNIILGYNSLIGELLTAKGDPDLDGYFAPTRLASQRLLNTIDAVLDISKIESGTFTINPHPIDLTQRVRRQIDDLKSLAMEKHLDVTLRIEEPDVVVSFDERCLNHAVRNLLDNAIKFTAKGGVSIRIYRDTAGRAALDVADSGIGIDQSYREKLFEPFSQQDPGSTRQFEGSGLGLALAKRYIELNGAEISVVSEPGKGSTFTIRFSGASQDKESPPWREGPRAATFVGAAPSGRIAVLVVEDDPETLLYMRRILNQNFVVLGACSGDEMRQCLEAGAETIRVILMDLALKGSEDGIALTRYLRQDARWKNVPIIAITAYASPEDRATALAAGCNDFLTKPLSPKLLLYTISTYLG